MRFLDRVHGLFQNLGFYHLLMDRLRDAGTKSALAMVVYIYVEEQALTAFEINVLEFEWLPFLFLFLFTQWCTVVMISD